MKVMIDATNISVGGGLQVSISVINELIVNPRNKKFIFVVSYNVFRQLVMPSDRDADIVVIDCKDKSMLNIYQYRNKMLDLERLHNIDIVFSIFGPSYWGPKHAKHLVGFANAWLVSPKSKAYSVLPITSRIITFVKNYILACVLYSPRKHYVTETKVAKELFIERFKCSNDMVDIVPNCLSQVFESSSEIDYYGLQKIDKFKFVTITHNYPHKNLNVIPVVGQRLEELGIGVIFIVTFPDEEYSKLSSDFKRFTLNIGPIPVERCKSVYSHSDALFLPTLIECFTVSYLEAFATDTIVITSDLDFAHDICGDAAFYFDPYDVNNIAKVCADVVLEHKSGGVQIRNKKNLYNLRLTTFGSNMDRVSAYMNIIDKLFEVNHVFK